MARWPVDPIMVAFPRHVALMRMKESTGIAVGLAIGVAMGLAFDNIGIGIGIGLALAIAAGLILHPRQDR